MTKPDNTSEARMALDASRVKRMLNVVGVGIGLTIVLGAATGRAIQSPTDFLEGLGDTVLAGSVTAYMAKKTKDAILDVDTNSVARTDAPHLSYERNSVYLSEPVKFVALMAGLGVMDGVLSTVPNTLALKTVMDVSTVGLAVLNDLDMRAPLSTLQKLGGPRTPSGDALAAGPQG